MAKRALNNGVIVNRTQTANGKVVFFAEAGPEGQVMVWDTDMIKPSVLLACLAWYFDREPPESPKPHLDFNPSGFRF